VPQSPSTSLSGPRADSAGSNAHHIGVGVFDLAGIDHDVTPPSFADVSSPLGLRRSLNNSLSRLRMRNFDNSRRSHSRKGRDDDVWSPFSSRCSTSAPISTLRRVSIARSCLLRRNCNVFFLASSSTSRWLIVLRVTMITPLHPGTELVARQRGWSNTLAPATRTSAGRCLQSKPGS